MNVGDKKTTIFLDTNVFQIFLGGFSSNKKESNVILHSTGTPEKYYDLVEFVNKSKLNSLVEICIPSVVVMECKEHMYECFSRNIESLDEAVKNYQKIFGDLIEFDVSLKIKAEEYECYVDSLFNEFFSNPRNQCKIVHYGKTDELLQTLLNKALKRIKPFVGGTIAGKNHSDAGFKDAIIAETIYEYCKANNRIGVFISSDSDFAEPFENSLTQTSAYVHFRNIDQTIESLKKFYQVTPKELVKEMFLTDQYMHEKLLHEAGVELDDSVTNIVLNEITTKDDKMFDIKISFVVNETIYAFNVQFDNIVNEIIHLTYKISND